MGTEKGLEIMDGSSDKRVWRWSAPKKRKGMIEKEEANVTKQQQQQKTVKNQPASSDIAVDDLFKVGHYTGQFLVFDDDGLLISNIDGSPISNRLRKKLLKKRQTFLEKKLDG